MNISKLASGLVLALGMNSIAMGEAGVIFQDNFDNQPDFTSTMHSTESAQDASLGFTLPEGWTHLYQGTRWSPETGYPDNHASLEILASNADKARGGSGKSAVFWRESYTPDSGWAMWNSDSQLMKILDRGYDQLYVEFYIRFSREWWNRTNASSYTSKMFRVGHWNGQGTPYSGYRGDLGPIAFWDYKRDNYGLRHVIAFRGGPPQTDNYYFKDQYRRGESRNYTSSIEGQEEGGTDPKLQDQVYGGNIVDYSGIVEHDQVFGDENRWTKVGFYVKMNSSPGATDGIYRIWVDGHRVLNRTNVPWTMDNPENRMVKWNYFAISGNDYFQAEPNSQRFEDWYAIDDVVVMDDYPGSTGGVDDGVMPPNPPQNITVE